ncbi:MAG TPA: hypothetical protein VJT14_16055 [Candidatus Dormibacteraeota bacterium]|nr:hypothetical protein [Candidatus Dormibacteraeota bacterium]
MVAAVTAACDTPRPTGPPSAKEILAKPQQSDLKDAHFLVSGEIFNSNPTLDLFGDGVLVYKPKPAGRIKSETTRGGKTVTLIQTISLDGTNYLRDEGSPKWHAVKTPLGVDPTFFAGSNLQKYVGEENLPQGKAWHVTALDKGGDAFDAYIRESDGYPIKYVETQGGQPLTLTFDRYNTGEKITAPAPDQIQAG